MAQFQTEALINRRLCIFNEPQAFFFFFFNHLPLLFLFKTSTLSQTCSEGWARTFSTRPPTRRRWGTRAGTVSSAPPLRSLCTWRWSWAATGGPVPSRTPRWCWRSPRRSGRPCRASGSPCSWAAWALREERLEALWVSYIRTHWHQFHISSSSSSSPSSTTSLSNFVGERARSEGGPGLMKRPRAGHLLLFNVARRSHYNIIDCWLARALKSH